ncbi:beta-alanine-activating enzyme-like [Nilaparvata lugens]|uniref:beta-alanine-activating enzyme-like n=1 Tax=Nilaparvata lugens TaxID=108931 RepID=UPI00193DB722|nr:beta-alanine-activating enzyme-like [Nilaparvata lugens]
MGYCCVVIHQPSMMFCSCRKSHEDNDLLRLQGILPASLQESWNPHCVQILLSGNPFMCLNVDGSENGLINLIKKLKIEILLTNEKYANKFRTKLEKSKKLKDFKLYEHACEIWKTGVSNDTSKNEDAARIDERERLLYAIQTSGSTGEKKIVQVTEDCILPNILELREVFNVCPTDVIYYGSPVTFDPHIVELFLALTSGASLFIVASKARAAAIPTLVDILFPEENSETPENDCARPTLLDVHFPEENPGNDGAISTLVDVHFPEENYEHDWCVTLIQTTPSVFLSWPKQQTRERVMRRLKVLALGGEECPSQDKLSDYCSPADFSKIYNLYGITEVSCWASYNNCLLEGTGRL